MGLCLFARENVAGQGIELDMSHENPAILGPLVYILKDSSRIPHIQAKLTF
ncbi:hypothetical protein DFO69_1578 [Bacillus subtilis]|nr:hypothetical protein DFO69_1578 [Bacillus subtilis]